MDFRNHNMTMSFTFDHDVDEDYGNRHSATTYGNDMTWEELTVKFLDFLRGCGFVIKDSDFEDFFNEHANQLIKAEEDECPCHDCSND